MTQAGVLISCPRERPIVPVMIYDEKKASELAECLLGKGIYLIAFSYPVVPKGKARIRVPIAAAHSRQETWIKSSKPSVISKERMNL